MVIIYSFLVAISCTTDIRVDVNRYYQKGEIYSPSVVIACTKLLTGLGKMQMERKMLNKEGFLFLIKIVLDAQHVPANEK